MRGGRRGQISDVNAPFYVMMRDAERKVLREALEYHDFNMTQAAETLGISYTLVWRRVTLLGGIMPNEPRREPFEYVQIKLHKDPDAKRRNRYPATRKSRARDGSAATQSNGAADGVRTEQGGPGDQADVK